MSQQDNAMHWHSEKMKGRLLVPLVEPIAVYLNDDGHVVIVQRDSMSEDGFDQLVEVPVELCGKLIKAIRAAAAQAKATDAGGER